MASNLVIVAIPADDDDVWKVSSEKKPHLTVLFLGESMTNPNVSKIVDYVKERSRELEPFSLLVDHRGVLGADEADVLFFSKDIPWRLIDFRETLKYNQEISMAYNAIPQHQDWKPHLTLGYSETPAHKDEWDPMGTQYVSFDKVAVWYGDSEGSEFLLTENPKSKWREDSPAIAEWADTVGDILAHHGVKGMKWGVRKAASAYKTADQAAGDFKFKRRANKTKTINKLVFQASKTTKAKDLPAINKKHAGSAKTNKGVILLRTSNVPAQKAYRNEVREAYRKRLEEVANSSTSESGRVKYTIVDKKGSSSSAIRWKVKATSVKHAADDDFEIEPVFDDNGFITDFKLVESAVAQTAEIGQEFLEHHGVKGMRWGIRRKNVGSANEKVVSTDAKKAAGASAKAKTHGKQALSNEEMQALVTRMNLERQLGQLTPPTRAQKGAKFVGNLLVNAGKQQAQLVVNDQINKQVKKALGAK